MISVKIVSFSAADAIGIMLFCPPPYLHHLSSAWGYCWKWRSKYSQEAEISFIYFPLQRVVYYWNLTWQILADFILEVPSGWNIPEPSECVGLDSCTFIHLLTNLGDWGLEEPFHILLWSPPFQTEQSRFLFSRPILYLLASPFICVFADYSRPVSWAWLKYQKLL